MILGDLLARRFASWRVTPFDRRLLRVHGCYTRWMRVILLCSLLVGCGSHFSTGTDATSAGDDGAPDTALGDANAPTVDAPTVPGLCPVGVADGCCPLLRYGGSDPDCPSLACEQLVASDPVRIVDQDNGPRGATAIAWTGTELVLAWPERLPAARHSIALQRRDRTGAITLTTVRSDRSGISTEGTTSLGYDTSSGSLAFVETAQASFRATGLSIGGVPSWEVGALFGICDGTTSVASVLPRDGTFAIAGAHATCTGNSGPTVAIVRADGTVQPGQDIADGARPDLSWATASACDAGCEHLTFVWDAWEAFARARDLNMQTNTLDLGYNLTVPGALASIDHQGLASDGSTFFHYLAIQTGTLGDTKLRFRRFQPGVGYLDDGFTTSGVRGLPPSVIWTGDGWIVAVAEYKISTSTAFPSDRRSYHIALWSFAPDGTLRATWKNEAEAGLYPQLAWAGGRVALTWVRVPVSGSEERYLRYLDCP